LATIICRADDGRVIYEERVVLAVAQEDRVAPLLQAIGERLAQPHEPRLQRLVAVQSAVGRTFD
jgi:hypothetical protein